MKRYETYKDSGIQWVGEIPSHWDSNKLKFFADISTGTTPSTANEEYWNEATENWYTPADFNEGDIHLNGSSRKFLPWLSKNPLVRYLRRMSFWL